MNTKTALAAGDYLRTWRQRRRMSQLNFALVAEISQRHLSFLESGRAAPSREMLLHLAERWRGEMMSDPEAVARFVHEIPGADAHHLRELIAKAQKEKAGDRPPKNFRELFHVVNALLQDHARRHP